MKTNQQRLYEINQFAEWLIAQSIPDALIQIVSTTFRVIDCYVWHLIGREMDREIIARRAALALFTMSDIEQLPKTKANRRIHAALETIWHYLHGAALVTALYPVAAQGDRRVR